MYHKGRYATLKIPMLERLPNRATINLPAPIREMGDAAALRFLDFFVSTIRNKNTRAAYLRACVAFLDWLEIQRMTLAQTQAFHVAAYIEGLMQTGKSIATVKQHLAAIRTLFDWLVIGQVIPLNPSHSVRAPKLIVTEGKTPVLSAHEAKVLLDAIETDTVQGLRDRALIALMIYSFARVGAVTQMKVGDYFSIGKRWKIRLHEKGGKHRVLPVHNKGEQYLDEYLEVAGISLLPQTPLFRSCTPKGKLTENGMHRTDVLRMVKRRAEKAGFAAASVCCHTFRGTGITTYLEHNGKLEIAQSIAGHASAKTTKLYDRRHESIELEEIHRIILE